MNRTLKRGDAANLHLSKLGRGHLLVAFDEHFAGCRINDIVTGILADHISAVIGMILDTVLFHFADRCLGELAVCLDDHLAALRIDNIDGRLLVGQQFGIGNLAECGHRQQ